MRTVESGREYQLQSEQGSNDQTIQFFQRTSRFLTNREVHENKAGEELPDYFFEVMGIDPDADSTEKSNNPMDMVQNDGVSVNEVVSVLIAHYKSFEEAGLSCPENEKSVEYLEGVLEQNMQRQSNRRLNRTYATLEK